MKEKDFYEVVSAIAQFIEKADSGGGDHPHENSIKNRKDEVTNESSYKHSGIKHKP